MSTLLEQLEYILEEHPRLRDRVGFEYHYNSKDKFCVTLYLVGAGISIISEVGLSIDWHRGYSQQEAILLKWFLDLAVVLGEEGFHFDLLEDIRLEFV